MRSDTFFLLVLSFSFFSLFVFLFVFCFCLLCCGFTSIFVFPSFWILKLCSLCPFRIKGLPALSHSFSINHKNQVGAYFGRGNRCIITNKTEISTRYFCSNQCPTTGISNAVVCIILSVGKMRIKIPCCQSKRIVHGVVSTSLPSHCLCGSLPYVWRRYNNMFWMRR